MRAWLFTLALLVFVMVMVGGATRLTDSGLSITEWQLIGGIVPPLNEDDWQDAFAKYRQIPEYRIVNPDMMLAAFKTIYWWEWAHRFLGRVVGFVFLFPFLLFWACGYIPRRRLGALAAMFLLGGAQGALGWHMVRSGLIDRVDVSQYRLAAHLGLAVVIFGFIMWVALRWPSARGDGRTATASGPRLSALGLTGLVFFQIVLGAFVAGLDAGRSHNTWPLMDGSLIPQGLGAMTPWYRNLFENALTVQFDHRMAAYVLLLWAVVHAVLAYRRFGEGREVLSAAALMALILAQAGLGIWTLLAGAPLGLSLVHQTGAMMVFAAAVYHLHLLTPRGI